ncbi:MAG: LamG domain-containing protein, partial [Sedimentisphaerales bacterium]|nr:LamG domain-containing protein [Sedimentisphaerales bacterium]
ATGTLYIDDVRLYPNVPEFVTPTEPGTESLVARYAFDGNANDGSGHGYNGTVQGSPTYVAGKDGQAIALDGVRQYVVVESVGITGAAPRTIAGWAKADTTSITAWGNIFGFTGPTGNGGHFDIEAVGDSGTNATLGYYGLHRYGWEFNILPIDLEWHHLAASFDGTTVRWYGDGMLVGSDDVDNVNTPGPFHVGKRQDNEVFFPGAVDEVRVYSEALADGEIAWLAGKRVPMHKPF